jgi:carbonic anhydrase
MRNFSSKDSHFLPRRSVLKALAGGVAAACPVCAVFAADSKPHGPQSAAHPSMVHKPHWGYDGAGGPDHWGSLDADFRTCDLGMEQSPIDLQSAVRAEVGQLAPNFRIFPITVVNNGHTIQVNAAPGNYTVIKGKRYELLQFHFHHPSEHLLSGRRFDLEMHFVHRAADGQLAVLGVFIRPGGYNAALAPVWRTMPHEAGATRQTAIPVQPSSLLPESRGYFRYQGSLTTPPCSEGVLWTVFNTPIEASRDQIMEFAKLFANNARPAQKKNRRFLLESL